MLACDNGHHRAVELLLRNGADIFTVDRLSKRSAIHYAASAGSIRVLKVLLADGTCIHTEDGMQPLKYVRVQDMSGQCRYIDSRAENGMTALHLAALMGHLECVQSLLDAGASMMVRTVDLEMSSTVSVPAGSTPLHLAAQQGNVAIVQAMLQAHSDAMGTWGRGIGGDGPGARRPWEGDGRIDLRSVANVLRQLPYHVAWVRGFRETAGILNPTVAIDQALENVREMQDGFGPQKLAVLAAYALRQNLLVWLHDYKQHWDEAIRSRRVIADQQQKRFAQAEMAHRTLTMPKVAAEDKGHMLSVLNGDSEPLTSPHGAVLPSPAASRSSRTLGQVSFRDEARTGMLGTSLASGRRPSDGPQPSDTSFARMSPLDEHAAHASLRSPVGAAAAAPSHIMGRTGRPSEDMPSAPPGIPRSAFLGLPEDTAAAPAGESTGSTEVVGGQSVQPPTNGAVSPFALFSAPSLDAELLRLHSNEASPPEANASWEPMRNRKKSVSFAGEATAPNSQPRMPSARSASFTGHSSYSPRIRPQANLDGLSPIISPMGSVSNGAGGLQGSGLSFVRTPSQHLGLPGEPDAVEGVDSTRRLSLTRALSKTLRRTGSRRTSFNGRRAPSKNPSMDLWRAASIQGFEVDDGLEECGICLSRPHEVCIGICHHMLCNECAISLCEAHKKPPMCPFCRRMIASFAPKPMGGLRKNMSFRLNTS
ncbi:hypothetical protein WJX84_004124 [Apatococcus fuscideae]|uniref:RING-type domain-containing protein n=1 Tax=Apatococcus fuscideae TaxID=2026836 RepID=A0AAW1TB92_9CHLO